MAKRKQSKPVEPEVKIGELVEPPLQNCQRFAQVLRAQLAAADGIKVLELPAGTQPGTPNRDDYEELRIQWTLPWSMLDNDTPDFRTLGLKMASKLYQALIRSGITSEQTQTWFCEKPEGQEFIWYEMDGETYCMTVAPSVMKQNHVDVVIHMSVPEDALPDI